MCTADETCEAGVCTIDLVLLQISPDWAGGCPRGYCGPDCATWCPAGPAGTVSSDNGSCDATLFSSGVCLCSRVPRRCVRVLVHRRHPERKRTYDRLWVPVR
jgi:hypothetical protein